MVSIKLENEVERRAYYTSIRIKEPYRPFHNFKASRSGDRRIIRSSDLKAVKGAVGEKPPDFELGLAERNHPCMPSFFERV